MRILLVSLGLFLSLVLLAQNRVKLRGASNNDTIYHNPLFVSNPRMADVSVFNGNDGFYYMIGSGAFNKQYLYRSTNLIDWECTNISPVAESAQTQMRGMKQPIEMRYPHLRFTNTLWAPHIVKVRKKFNMYTSLAAYGGIVCLQSDNPTGPYIFPHKDKKGNAKKLIDLDDVGMEFDVIDPCFVNDHSNGKNYLFFGSSFGIYRVELSKDGTALKRNAKFVHVAGSIDRGKHGVDYEGTMLYWHGGYWYMILSPRRDYRLLCWRSKTLTGHFVDKNGNTPFSNRYGWEILRPQARDYVTPEGYHLAVTGHSGEIVMDKSNRFFIFCHASVTLPTKNEAYGHRAPCLTEIIWDEDGWPVATTKDRKVSYENRRPDM